MEAAGPLALEVANSASGALPPTWVVSPHLLVAQAVTVALREAGASVEFHAWGAVVDDARSRPRSAAVQHVLAIFDGVGDPEEVAQIGRLVALGDVRVAVSDPAVSRAWWGGLVAGGAVDVVTMTSSVGQLADMLERFTAGQVLMDPDERASLHADWVAALDKQQDVTSLIATLSPRQLRVLELLASGRRVHEVAQLLGVTDGTVRSHVKTLRHKLGARTQLEAVAMLRQVHDFGGGVVPAMVRPRQSPEGRPGRMLRR